MEDVAELAMEGVPLMTEHYDKVYDPVKNKTKQGVQKIKKMREQRKGGGYESETESDYEEYDRYGPPQRSQTDGRRRVGDDNRRRSRRDNDYVDERYSYPKGNGRAKSAGGDGGRDRYRRG